MSENSPPTYSQLIRKLPYRLQRRFESFGNYVESILDENEPGWRLTEEELDGIKLLAFIFALKVFFKQGTVIARNAIQVFKDLGAIGFVVGKTDFTVENENTLRGEKLSNWLNEMLYENNLSALLRDDKPISSIILEIARGFLNGKSMDRSRENT